MVIYPSEIRIFKGEPGRLKGAFPYIRLMRTLFVEKARIIQRQKKNLIAIRNPLDNLQRGLTEDEISL